MNQALAETSFLAVATTDGATVNVQHLAGRAGSVVLVLPANGFPIRCYTPIAQQLAGYGFQCWGIEFRGQGSLPAPQGCLLELYLHDVCTIVAALGLRGCLTFTHSGGAQIAIKAEATQPGTFSAIYAFEPVLWPANSCDPSDSQHLSLGYLALAAFAKKRRAHFQSKQDAARRFRSRPPFCAFHKSCFEQYVEHGLIEQHDGSCTLAISTELEARCYLDAGQAAMRTDHNDHPKVQCPITVGVGDSNQGPVSFLAAEGIKQARRFPQGRSERFTGLAHLGPLEDPARVAVRAVQTFRASKDAAAWASLPSEETIEPHYQAKL